MVKETPNDKTYWFIASYTSEASLLFIHLFTATSRVPFIAGLRGSGGAMIVEFKWGDDFWEHPPWMGKCHTSTGGSGFLGVPKPQTV